jgi:spoIIIJ-associated protein
MSGFFGLFKGRKASFEDEEKEQLNFARSRRESEDIEDIEGDFNLPENLDMDFDSDEPDVITDEMSSYAIEFLTTILNTSELGGSASETKRTGSKLCLEISDSEETGRIIGREGNNLDALQTLIRAAVFKKFSTPLKVILDAGGFRQKRQEKVKKNALTAARSVLNKGRRVELHPMNAAERRFVHMMFQEEDRIKTYSVGDGDSRRIVLERQGKGRKGNGNK